MFDGQEKTSLSRDGLEKDDLSSAPSTFRMYWHFRRFRVKKGNFTAFMVLAKFGELCKQYPHKPKRSKTTINYPNRRSNHGLSCHGSEFHYPHQQATYHYPVVPSGYTVSQQQIFGSDFLEKDQLLHSLKSIMKSLKYQYKNNLLPPTKNPNLFLESNSPSSKHHAISTSESDNPFSYAVGSGKISSPLSSSQEE